VARDKKVPGGSAVGVPNTKDVKQMLLDWCRVKTEPYEVGLKRANKIKSNSFCFATFLWLCSPPSVNLMETCPDHISPEVFNIKKIKPILRISFAF